MRRNAKITFAVTCAMSALAWLGSAPAQASEEHLFDPVLSLTGSTAVSAEDPVPDPGPGHPAEGFKQPCGAAVDGHGDIYVANPGITASNGFGPGGRIDIFDPQGRFLTEIVNENGPCGLATDSHGNVYVVEKRNHVAGSGLEESNKTFISLYEPDSYPPSTATTYSLVKQFEFIVKESGQAVDLCAEAKAIAVDPSTDHLYVGHGCRVTEYGSAAEGSPLVNCCIGGAPDESGIVGVDVYGKNHDVYVERSKVNQAPPPTFRSTILVFDGADGHKKCELEGTGESGGEFEFDLGGGVALDQANGDFYVYDYGRNAAEQFGSTGGCPHFIGLLNMSPKPATVSSPYLDIAVDDPCRTGIELSEPCSAGEAYDSPNPGYVYVTAGTLPKNSHLFAFKPRIVSPPQIQGQAVDGITESEAVLQAELNPGALDTHYRFEYTTQASFKADGYESATSVPVPDADAGSGGSFAAVSEPIRGLAPGVTYHFRLVAVNCEPEAPEEACVTKGEGKPGEEGEDASFTTYPALAGSGPCLNEALRTGPSASLPDCRAYELVTPPDTNGRLPTMAMLGEGNHTGAFDTAMASPDRDSLVFGSNTGSLPGIGGGGYNDTFEAVRNQETGWQSRFTGPSGTQARTPSPGGISLDHRYAFWNVQFEAGTLAEPITSNAEYLRVPVGSPESSLNCAPAAEPDGQFEWIGCGSFGIEPRADGKWISAGGDHVIFATDPNNGLKAQQLESCAPPTGIGAIYDRTPGGATRCVSVPPAAASAETEAAFQATSAVYRGVSADGSTVAFSVGGALYTRIDNTETVLVATGSPVFGGLSKDGDRILYLEGGDIFACDLASGGCAGEGSHAPIPIGSGGESTLVNVSADGSHAYFVSPKVLDGAEEGVLGEDNLYVWDGSTIDLVTILEPSDLSPEPGVFAGQGLELWVSGALHPSPGIGNGPALDPSRATPNGRVLVFQSHADLTSYRSGGHREIYRYDSEALPGGQLICVSCSPIGAAATSGAQLESSASGAPGAPFPPLNSLTHIANVTADGSKVFFQSADRLVSADNDGKVDVYEWEAEGSGGCEREGGCLSLISGGSSAGDDYLYAMTPDGHDVFFLSADKLLAQDPDGSPSIYDARIEGGFPPAGLPAGECLGEACQPATAPPREFSSAIEEEASPGPAKRCPKGRHKVRRDGKIRCVKHRAHGKHRNHHLAHSKRRTAQ
jgi:hypothetical protein